MNEPAGGKISKNDTRKFGNEDVTANVSVSSSELPSSSGVRSQKATALNVVIGNHLHRHGIGEILYTLKAFFSRRAYEVTYSPDLTAGATNILIDEFSIHGTLLRMQKCKKDHPETKFIIVATEFPTPLRFFGMDFGETFNHFDFWEDFKYGSAVAKYRLGLNREPPYMHARYLGFSEALRLADLVVAVHPAIVAALLPLAAEMGHWVSPPLDFYPEIGADEAALAARLREWPSGFVTTGTMTPFRKKIATTLMRSSRMVGIQGPVYTHLPFDRTEAFTLHDGAIEFPFEKFGSEDDKEKKLERYSDKARLELGCLFNLNPPQRANWRYSSPMRILRAVLYGQIPVVTQRFADHEIEAIAKLWDPKSRDLTTFGKLWTAASVDREKLIAQHMAAVSNYNRIAIQKNEAFDLALKRLSDADRAAGVRVA